MSEPAVDPKNPIVVHGSCVAIADQGVLIIGASGSGKSYLALQLMALGAELVADDRTVLQRGENMVVASSPKQISGMIEARGVGLLAAKARENAALRLVIDLDKTEKERLPERREVEIAGHLITCLHKVESPSFPAAVALMMKGGRVSPT